MKKNFLLVPYAKATAFSRLAVPYFWLHDIVLADGSAVEPIIFKANSKEDIPLVIKKQLDWLYISGKTTVTEEVKRFEICLKAIWPHYNDTMPPGLISALEEQGIYVRGEDTFLVRT